MKCPCGCEQKVPFKRLASARVAKKVARTVAEVEQFERFVVEVKPDRNTESIVGFEKEGAAYFSSILLSIHDDAPTPEMVPQMTVDWLKRSSKLGLRIRNPKTRGYKHVENLARDQGISIDDATNLWLERPTEDAYTYLKPPREWQEIVDSLIAVVDDVADASGAGAVST